MADDPDRGAEPVHSRRVTRLRRRRASSTVIVVDLDGERLAALEDVEVVQFGLAIGREVDGELEKAILLTARRGDARRRAARLLASRPHARRELERKVARTSGAELATEVVADLERRGLLDDEAYARRLIERLLTRGYGPLRITFDLRRAGVARATSDRLLAEIERERVRDALLVASRGSTDDAGRQRAFRRGFSPESIEDVLGLDEETP